MVTDVREEENGVFHLWGVTADGDSVLARIPDFEPYFYVTAPEQSCDAQQDDSSALVGTLNRCAATLTPLLQQARCWEVCHTPIVPSSDSTAGHGASECPREHAQERRTELGDRMR